jgi:hypothetical protein
MHIIRKKKLSEGRWFELEFCEQMANVGSEVGRAISWRSRDAGNSSLAFDRALGLLDLTIADARNRKRLREITRVREVLVDYFCYDNTYASSDELWNKYFLAFNYEARKNR